MIFQNCDCEFCSKGLQRVIFPIYFNGHVNYWLDIPKNASTSIKYKFKLEGLPPLNKEIYPVMAANGTKIYAIWREPMERFVSLLNHYLTRSGPYGRFNRGQKFFASMGIDIEKVPLEQRVRIMMLHLEELTGFHFVHHWYPQTYWLPEEFEFNWVAMKDVERVFGIGITNPGSGRITEDMLSPQQKEFVYEEYKDDFDYFKDMK